MSEYKKNKIKKKAEFIFNDPMYTQEFLLNPTERNVFLSMFISLKITSAVKMQDMIDDMFTLYEDKFLTVK